MSGKWSIPKRCYCKDPETGRDIGGTCLKLKDRHHGVRGYSTRIPTSSTTRELRRFGFATVAEANSAARQVWDLLGLARWDAATQRRSGGLIWEKARHSGDLPSVEDVRRRRGWWRASDHCRTVSAEDARRRNWERFTIEVLENVSHYQVPVIKLTAGTPKVAVCTVFEKVNTGDVPLNVSELLKATYAGDREYLEERGEDFQLTSRWRQVKDELSGHAMLGQLESTDFLQAVCLVSSHFQRRGRPGVDPFTRPDLAPKWGAFADLARPPSRSSTATRSGSAPTAPMGIRIKE